MKFLLISRPRTRSTLLIDALSKYYNITDKDENYKFTINKMPSTILKPENIETYFNSFQTLFKNAVQANFKENNFAIKLYPRMLMLGKHDISDLDSYSYKMITNLTYYTNIKKYDKIYYLTRNLKDSICSWAYGNALNYYNFRDKETLEAKRNSLPSITIDIENDGELKFYIYESAILTHWKKFLIDTNIIFTEVDYNDTPQYVSDNFPNIKSKTIDSQFDYSKIITNYYEIDNFINDFYVRSLEETKDIKFT